jgi:hypothetical protein
MRRLVWLLCLTIAASSTLPVVSDSAGLEFQAGSASVVLQPPDGISLAGYGGGARRHWLGEQNRFARYLTASNGTHDEVRSKAVVLQFGKAKLAIVSVDLVIPSGAMHRELARRLVDLGFNETSIILAATHTHSGPSSYIQNTILEFFALDRYVPEVWQRMTGAVERSIREADSRLVSARLAVGTRPIPGVTSNRRRHVPLDSVMTMIRIDSADGKPVAAVLNFPIHPTMMGTKNLLLSADLAGEIERAFHRKSGSLALFMNGAEGDVAPSGPRGEFGMIETLGERIAGEAFLLWKSLVPVLPTSFRLIRLDADVGPASLNILPCLKLDIGSGKWNPALSDWPTRASLTGFSIDAHAFVAVPGEPAAAIGNTMQDAGTRVGFSTTSILGLSNDYVGYILPKDDYLKGGYESCVSFYGPSLGEKIQEAMIRLLDALVAH